MKAIYKETGEVVDVRCESEAIWVEENKYEADRREWEESELVFPEEVCKHQGMTLDDCKHLIDSYFEKQTPEEFTKKLEDSCAEKTSCVEGYLTRIQNGDLLFYNNDIHTLLDSTLCPEVTFENSPKKCKIEITLL